MAFREWRKGLLGGEGVYLTLQMQRTENSKQIFPEMKLCGLVPSFYIHASDLYITTVSKRNTAK